MKKYNPSDFLSHPSAYLIWQAPFARKKLAPFFSHNKEIKVSVILDVGCGPGTNVPLLREMCDFYYGIDLSEHYISHASRLYPNCNFSAADATTSKAYECIPKSELIILNSLMHHLSDEQVRQTLRIVRDKSTMNGRIHIIDLIIPDEIGFPRLLAKLDRGDYPRSRIHWLQLLDEHFETEVFEEFTVSSGPIGLWRLFYWNGLPKHKHNNQNIHLE